MWISRDQKNELERSVNDLEIDACCLRVSTGEGLERVGVAWHVRRKKELCLNTLV